MVAHTGDGYVNTPMDTGSENPHSPAELLRGVTIGKLALFVLYKLADVAALELLLNVGEKVRLRTQVVYLCREREAQSSSGSSRPQLDTILHIHSPRLSRRRARTKGVGTSVRLKNVKILQTLL